MFIESEIEVVSQFFDITNNKDNIFLCMNSKSSKNQWIVVDFSEKFEDRYGIYLKTPKDETFKNFNQVKAITNVLNLISSFETKK